MLPTMQPPRRPKPKPIPPTARSASVSSSAMSRFLLTALALSLMGCATNSKTLPPPPIVQCEQGPTAPVPPIPEDWLTDGPVWALGVLGLLE